MNAQKILLALCILSILFGCTKTVEVNTKKLNVSSSFPNGIIPDKYTCNGSNINPPLAISNIPSETKTLALIVDDPDAPMKTFVHWVMWNIPVANIEENSAPGEQGKNDFNKNKYSGPCPPSGTHRYFFKVHALDTELNLPPSTTKVDLEKAMNGHILAEGALTGKYSKKTTVS